ncbi:autotransporter domain-containing protein [Mesorhizobium sp. CGMCC 1.15528]|uniref:Autotransporter domain-containing protein n=1 Tax=Mesorhizobium zhangyense TaxID=1776730 RepID=A0A7C9VAI2_9HYPH|nr:putative Ig domain-containing protein [Mesorhizobium zhangyense]NGN39688.1 autotransporter domain-containing protein [Mesorhizobium zhangyense]
MTFRGGHRNIVTDGGKACPVKSPLSRLVLFLALLFAGLGFTASAQAQTAIVTWDEPVPVSAIGGPSGMLSSGDAVDVDTIVTFRIDILTGMTYRSPPSGCNITHDDGDTWRATITETCHVAIQTSVITMFAIGPTEVALGGNYTNDIFVNGGNSPFTFTLASGDLPDGISLSNRGTLSGMPSEAGSFDFTIRATNEYGHFGTQSFTLTVLGAGTAPTITNVSPSTGPAEGGTSVVITGTNLTDATAVTFGDAPAASFAVITDTVITAITEAHAQGPVDVAVTTPNGNATAASAFTYDAPVVLSLSIDDVTVVEGDSGSTFVTFNITLDRTVPQFREVTFDIATADGTATAGVDYVALSGTGVSIGPGSIGGPVTVQILGDTLSEPNETFFVNVTNVVGATVVDGQGVGTIVDNDTSAAPTITSISPTNGPTAGGTSVVITGTNLTGATAVIFGSTAVISFTVDSATQITATTSAHAEGPVDVAVTTPGGSATAAGAFTYDAPVVPRLSINDVSAVESNGNVAFTVSLDSPAGPGGVTFDVTTADGTAIGGQDYHTHSGSGYIPAGTNVYYHSVGMIDDALDEANETFFLNVSNVAGAVIADGVGQGTIVNDDAAPTITGIAPPSGPSAGGTTVTITGTDFTDASAVSFGGTAASSFTVDSATRITATTPAHAEGPVDVVVLTPSGDDTATGAFTYNAPVLPSLSISDVTVSEGNSGQTWAVFTVSIDQATSTAVTMDIASADGTAIAGDDYLTNAVSSVGISPGVTSRQFDVRILGDTLNEPDETFFVNVTNVVGATVVKGQGVGTIVNDDVAAPTIASVAPTSGTTEGGTSVVITGTDLTGATAVTFGGTEATSFTVDSATQITATTPTHAEGAVDVVVTTPGGSATATGAFTYEVPASNDASLSNLLISAGTLNPAFAPGTTGYTVSVPSTVSSLTLTPTAADTGATITVNGQSVTSGSASSGISLATGDTTITVVVTAQDGTTTRTYTVTVTRAEPTITVGPNALPGGSVGSGYGPVTLTANGGTGPYSFEVTAGNLPAGLSLSIGGEFNGTPTVAGSFTFTVTATDDNGFTGTREYTLAIDAPTITIAPDTLPGGSAGVAYEPVAMTADGGEAPYAFTVTTGDLPEGLSLATTGELSGTPTEAGNFTFTVTATDDNDFTGTREYTLAVDAPTISIDPDALADGVAGSAYGPVALSADGGTGPYGFKVTAGDLPAGLSLATTGEITGTPNETGSFTFTATATDDNDFTGTREYTLAIGAPAITIDPDSLADGTAGSAYGPVTLTADGGNEPYSYEVTAGELPAGLSLNTGGEFAGTPTEAGSFAFTVTATDDNGFTGARRLSLSIAAPEIEISVPPLADGRVNSVYEMVQLSASGGTASYEFAVTGGKLPKGIVLAADGALSGTPTEAGDFSATVTATDGLGFTGTANLSIKIRNLNVPVARDMTLEVMSGTRGSIDLTKGAANGPFTRADIAVYPATEAGKASIRGERAAYMLDFAAAGTFEGSASLQYTLSNADGRSAPATVTLNIIARPDPSQDPEVIGLLTAQAEAAKRFARTQTDNFNRRLEQLHDEGERRRNSMNVNIGLTQRDSDQAAYAEEDERDPVADAFRRMDAGKKESETPASGSADYNPLGNFAVWSGGYVNFAESDNGSIDLDSTLVGVSGGVDYRFTPKFVGGLGFGYGRDKTDVGGNGTESRGRAWSMAAYGSYKPTPEIFIDGLIGYGLMDFDSRRYVTATGDFATGSRGGQQIFGSLTVGYEYRQDRWLLSPYGRLEASRSKLDAFSESDGGIWGLTYGDQTIDTLSGILGLRLEYALSMDWGVFKPRARLEYTHDFEGSSRASLGYADIGTLPYSIDIDQFSRDHLTIGLGFDAQIGDAWNLGFDYQTAYGSGGQSQDHTFAIKVGARF